MFQSPQSSCKEIVSGLTSNIVSSVIQEPKEMHSFFKNKYIRTMTCITKKNQKEKLIMVSKRGEQIIND